MPYAEAGPDVQLSCASPSVTIGNPNFQNNVTWRWAGPGGFTSTIKNPVVSLPGTYTLTVTGGSCTYTDEVIVSPPADNCAPTIAAITNKTLNELTNLPSTILSASDPNGDPLTFSFRHAVDGGEMNDGLPDGAAFNTTTRALTWRPSEAQGPGVFTIEVTASDGELSGTRSFTITVNEVNTAPIYDPISNAYGKVGEKIEFTVRATDHDVPGTQTITLSLSGTNGVYPAGATITNILPSSNPQEGLFSWTPAANQVGRAAVYALANDGLRGQASPTFYLYVNAPPRLNAITAKSVEAGKKLTFQLSGSDVNSSSDMFSSPHQSRSFSVEVTPVEVQGEYSTDDVPAITKIEGDWTGNQAITGANTSTITGIFDWTPTTPGTYTVKIKLQDNGISGNFPLSDEKSFTVTVTPPPVTYYSLTLTPPENGSIRHEPAGETYEAGTVVTLTAEAHEGFRFTGWTGDATGTSNPLALTMSGNKTVSASFEAIPTYKLTITNPDNGSGTIGHTPEADQEGKYTEDTEVTLTAIPANGYQFTGWTGDASGDVNPLKLIMDADKNVSATFELIPPTVYTLTLHDPTNGSIEADPAADSYVAGTEVTLRAIPDDGYRFTGWSGDASGTEATTAVVMNANKTVSATFEPIPTFTLTIAESSNGSITQDPAPDQTGKYREGTMVTLTAEPASGYRFTGWAGDVTGVELTTTITMDADKHASATFELILPTMYKLTLTQPENGSISLEPSADTYEAGSVVTLTATAASGFRFAGWTGDASGTANPLQLTMNADKAVSATFEAIPASGPQVTGFVLVSAQTEQDVLTIADGAAISFASLPNTKLNIRANTSPGAVGSVRFELSGAQSKTFVDNQAPYALHGDDGAGNYYYGNWNPPATGTYTLTATPYSGPRATGTAGTPLTITFTLNRDGGTPPTQYSLNTGTMGNGTVAKSPDQSTYASGSFVTITATAASGSRFVGWTGDASGSQNPLSITMTSNKSITAVFETIQSNTYVLSVNSSNGGSVTKSPNQNSYTAGTVVTLTASPAAGFRFAGWTGDASGTANPLQLTMNADKAVSATFEAIPASGPQVTGFVLVSAQTEQDVLTIADGAAISFASLPNTKLNIRANTSPGAVGSVRFELSGAQSKTFVDNQAPYALHGDDGAGNYYYGNWNPPATGTYTLTATPYSGPRATGTAGTPLTITFTFNRDGALINNATSSLSAVNPEASKLYVYPNPTSDGRIKLMLSDGETGKVRYSLVNSIGERLYSGELIREESSKQVNLDFSEKMRTPGVYFLRVEYPQQTKVFKLMKTL
ncbi:InlB B-repeat-containing protein [Pontibacter indicus]